MWDRWIHATAPETSFPEVVQRSLTPFQVLLVIQALRPDRVETAMGVFVCQVLRVAIPHRTSKSLPTALLVRIVSHHSRWVVTKRRRPSPWCGRRRAVEVGY